MMKLTQILSLSRVAAVTTAVLAVMYGPTLLAGGGEIDLGPQTSLDLEAAQFRVWFPDDAKTLRGTLFLIPGKNGDGRGLAGDANWQAWAAKNGFALLACNLKDDDQEAGYQMMPATVELLEKALAEAAKVAQHPEIATGPLAFWGHSAGANLSRVFTGLHAKRVVVMAVTKATAGGPSDVRDALEVPVLLTTGAKEKADWRKSNQDSWTQARKSGAVWAIGDHPNEGHEAGKTLEAIRPFMDDAITLRLGAASPAPETGRPALGQRPTRSTGGGGPSLNKVKDQDGWLGDLTTKEVTPYKDFKGNKRIACWFPGEASAKAWQGYLK